MKPDARKTVYEGRLIEVVLERWGDHEREVVRHPGSVAVVAVDREGRVVLVRQTREPARRRLLELPAGTLEEGEQSLASAQRELMEETGLSGGRWRDLGAYWTSPGFLDERMHFFAAEELEEGDASPESDEELEVVRWPVAEVGPRLRELEDLKTVAGLLLFLQSG